MLLILGSSPMVEGIPAFFAASLYGVGLLAVMAVVFAASTMVTYVALCVYSAAGLCQLSSLLGATFSGCGASCSGSFQNTKHDGCPAHVVNAPCSGGNVLAHARSRAEEVAEFVVTAAISPC